MRLAAFWLWSCAAVQRSRFRAALRSKISKSVSPSFLILRFHVLEGKKNTKFYSKSFRKTREKRSGRFSELRGFLIPFLALKLLQSWTGKWEKLYIVNLALTVLGWKEKKYPPSTANKLANEFVIDNLLELLVKEIYILLNMPYKLKSFVFFQD